MLISRDDQTLGIQCRETLDTGLTHPMCDIGACDFMAESLGCRVRMPGKSVAYREVWPLERDCSPWSVGSPEEYLPDDSFIADELHRGAESPPALKMG